MLIDTNRGDLYVIGSHLINETIIAIFKLIIEIAAPHNGVRKLGMNMITFREDQYPRTKKGGPANWVFHPDSRAAVCSLQNIVENAFIDVKTKEEMSSTSIKAIVWDNLLQGFSHELHHAYSYKFNRQELEYSARARDKEEQMAEDTAHNIIQYLCQLYDIEPQLPTEVEALINSTWAKEEREAILLQSKGTPLKKWFIMQKYMRDNNIMYFDVDDQQQLSTYRENRARCSSRNPELWKQTTKAVPKRVVKNGKIKTEVITKVSEHKPIETVTPIVLPVQKEIPEVVQEEITQPVTQVNEQLFYEPGEYVANEEVDFNNIMDQSIFDDPNNVLVDDGVREQLVEDVEPEEILEHQLPSGQANVYTPRVYTPYKPTGLDNPTTSKIMRGIYMKIYNHLVNKCGWKIDGTFSSPAKIFIQIELSDEEKRVVKAFSSIVHGRYQDQITVGSWILGINISKDGKSIGYKLHIAMPNGDHVVRHIFTPKPDGLGIDSQEIRTGNKLVWIIDPDKQVKTGESKFSTRVYNGQFQVLNQGKWEAR